MLSKSLRLLDIPCERQLTQLVASVLQCLLNSLESREVKAPLIFTFLLPLSADMMLGVSWQTITPLCGVALFGGLFVCIHLTLTETEYQFMHTQLSVSNCLNCVNLLRWLHAVR